nr:pentapeptide repeat-containing protein [Mycobacterium alsense]
MANTGGFNPGSYNTGSFNPGNLNTGGFNPGSVNTGYFNTGNVNTGVANSGDVDTGAFLSSSLTRGVLWGDTNQGSALDYTLVIPPIPLGIDVNGTFDFTVPHLNIPGIPLDFAVGGHVGPIRIAPFTLPALQASGSVTTIQPISVLIHMNTISVDGGDAGFSGDVGPIDTSIFINLGANFSFGTTPSGFTGISIAEIPLNVLATGGLGQIAIPQIDLQPIPLHFGTGGSTIGPISVPINIPEFGNSTTAPSSGFLNSGAGGSSGFANIGAGTSGFWNSAPVGAGISGFHNFGALVSGALNLGNTVSGLSNVSTLGPQTAALISGIGHLGDTLSGVSSNFSGGHLSGPSGLDTTLVIPPVPLGIAVNGSVGGISVPSFTVPAIPLNIGVGGDVGGVVLPSIQVPAIHFDSAVFGVAGRNFLTVGFQTNSFPLNVGTAGLHHGQVDTISGALGVSLPQPGIQVGGGTNAFDTPAITISKIPLDLTVLGDIGPIRFPGIDIAAVPLHIDASGTFGPINVPIHIPSLESIPSALVNGAHYNVVTPPIPLGIHVHGTVGDIAIPSLTIPEIPLNIGVGGSVGPVTALSFTVPQLGLTAGVSTPQAFVSSFGVNAFSFSLDGSQSDNGAIQGSFSPIFGTLTTTLGLNFTASTAPFTIPGFSIPEIQPNISTTGGIGPITTPAIDIPAFPLQFDAGGTIGPIGLEIDTSGLGHLGANAPVLANLSGLGSAALQDLAGLSGPLATSISGFASALNSAATAIAGEISGLHF